MFRAFTDIAELIGQMVPPWLLAPLAGLILLAALPFWLQSMRSKKISARVRRLVRAEGEARVQLCQEIFEIAGDRPSLLVTAIGQAIRYDQRDLRDQAIVRLEATGKGAEDLVHIRKKLEPERKPVAHPLEVAVGVERLIEEGMLETARQRIAEGLVRYPGDPDLQALESRVKKLL